MKFNSPHIEALLNLAISEDLLLGDITSEMLISDQLTGFGQLIAKQDFVVAGQIMARTVFQRIDPSLDYQILIQDGNETQDKQIISTISGSVRSILAGERIALNFLQRLSGIATATHQAVVSVQDKTCKIIDTRKTTPGWRILEKYAVRMGGGQNHRMSLGDGILIKDNHIKALGSVSETIKQALKKRRHPLKIQVEVTSYKEAESAVSSGADALLLDNMSPEEIKVIAERFKDKVTLETSGNISQNTLSGYSEAGVHLISMGKLTHSVMACDISLKLK